MQEKARAAKASSPSLDKAKSQIPQHKGFGKQLLRAAERCAAEAGFDRIAVISGVGVREYYRKQGYLDVSRSRVSSAGDSQDRKTSASNVSSANDESVWIYGGSDGDDHSGFRRAGRADGGFLIKTGLQNALISGKLDAPRWQPCDIDAETGVPIARAKLPATVLVAALAVALALVTMLAGQGAHVARITMEAIW